MSEQAPHRGSRLIKNSVHDLFNRLFMLGTTWAISIWVARQLGVEQYGIFTYVLWFASSFTWILGMGLTHAVTKYIAEYQGRGRKSGRPIILFVLKIEIVISTVVTLILVALHTRIADYFFSPRESFYFLLAFLGLVPGMITAIFASAVEGIQKFEHFTRANLIITPLSFLSKIAVLFFGFGITGLLSVMLTFSFINSFFYFFVLRHEKILSARNRTPMPTGLKKRILAYNGSIIPIILCDKIIWDKSENFFLARLCAAREVAFYNLGFNIARQFTSLLPMTFWRVLFPAMSHYFGSGDKQKMKRLFFITTRYVAFIAFPVGIAGALLAYPLIHYLYGHDYIGAQRTLQIIFLCSILSSLTKPASAILYGYEKQAFIYRYGFVLAAINIFLDILLIKRYGALGAAICYGATTLLAAGGGLFYTCRTFKLSYPFVSIFKICFSSIIMGIVMELIILQYPTLPGYLLSGAAGIFVYLVGAIVLGTFEQEDYVLLRSVKKSLPRPLHKTIEACISLIGQFKQESGPRE